MDAREHGSKPGSGAVSANQEAVDRRERLRRLALETIDLAKDPYYFRNHLGQIEYPEIEEGFKPRHRFMSSYEQRKEPWDKHYQYLLFAAEPYEVIAFKVPTLEVDRHQTDRLFSHWYEERS
ncbi:Splicing factor 3A subunit 2 [Auxenochlorella protothecoides]|uniref:Splicing factor 3A subunit 2 n=1 Tax=Auxenochlorella protothecoides TaxID=3075 RepID=A0A087SRF2_AUXPR|nr:Splicing factor 3A subunit 2 [Auxenochlorella protothecoides]KFM28306.1 Splicing factor 3A subunit 2 [Auxenochlorella protothecoides]